ncbi:MAG: rod shape-determining protein MreC [Clostridia bacterium]|nr:rod shape-determining protein MreC [Clostridia bacterium]
MRIFQNKFFIICLCIALVLTIVPSVFSIMGYRSLAKNIVGTVTMPVRWVATVVADSFEGFAKYFGNMKALNEENEALIEENEALKEQLANAELLERENERLRDYLDMKNQYPSFSMEEGMVISHSSGNYITNFTLNRGTLHGIAVNMPVVTKDGIVGYVVEVGLNWCMVSTLIETATSVGVYIPRSEVQGIVSGDYSMRQEGTCKISYIDAEADIQIGDVVYSSGAGSVYPADLKIGTVTAIEVNEYNRTLVVTVTPAVDFSQLKWVMIITGYEKNSGMQ